MYSSGVKRVADFFSAFLLLSLLSPVILVVSGLLALANRGGIFFVQPRPGLNEKVFNLIKFKTMNDRRDSNGKLLPDRDRITKIGRWVRSTSLDELPQLINVLKGDMSLVGPRPLLVKYLDLYNDFQKQRHNVKPGITGWAQVNGRNTLSWEEKFKHDVWYVENQSFFLDLRILFLTLKKVVVRDGINASESNTMKVFKGNDL
jgi:lipopolysaccharide/colanic/teichoic acid biosynthesis glycosyltransferase